MRGLFSKQQPLVKPAHIKKGTGVLRFLLCATVSTLALTVFAETINLTMTTSAQAAAERDLLSAKPKNPNAEMMVVADQLIYNQDDKKVTATGNVEIYYDRYTLQGDKVTYMREAGRVIAEGNVKITAPDGTVSYADHADVTDNFREGFIKAINVETPQKTRFAALEGRSHNEAIMIYERGVYTACEPCKDDPKKPPTWQIKSARVVHDKVEKTLYYKNASVELLGFPIAYFPYLSSPDPTVKRRTGFLVPSPFYTKNSGYGLQVPYFINLAPNYDITLSPVYTSRQGLLAKGEWRHRLEDGSYSVRLAGISEKDLDPLTPGQRDERGSIETRGRFAINEKWDWGWDISAISDRTFLRNYNLIRKTKTELTNQLYLRGLGEQSAFDIRTYQFLPLTGINNFDPDYKGTQPLVHPVLDYNYIFSQPIAGGRLGFDMNLTSLSREISNFDPVWPGDQKLPLGAAYRDSNACSQYYYQGGYNPYTGIVPSKCFLRGAAGNMSRFTTDLHWKRQMIDDFGQVFTPFASVRTDLFWSRPDNNDLILRNYPGLYEGTFAKVMPTIGMEYRYPFVNVSEWGTQTIEPIAQVIVRPAETRGQRVSNEDARSLVYDDTTLFSRNKYSGFDRTEGGTRINAGLQYAVHMAKGGYISAMFGQSYHIAGRNSYEAPDLTQVGLNSGLDKDRADYVGRIYFEPWTNLAMSARARFDEDTFDTKRMEADASTTLGRLSTSISYSYLAKQPLLGEPRNRSDVANTLTYQLTETWRAFGMIRYDLERDRVVSDAFGVQYIDDCFIFTLGYYADYYRDLDLKPDQRIVARFNLRTIGVGGLSASLNDLMN